MGTYRIQSLGCKTTGVVRGTCGFWRHLRVLAAPCGCTRSFLGGMVLRDEVASLQNSPAYRTLVLWQLMLTNQDWRS